MAAGVTTELRERGLDRGVGGSSQLSLDDPREGILHSLETASSYVKLFPVEQPRPSC